MWKTNTLINACKGENKSRANGLTERLCGRATCHILLGGGIERERERRERGGPIAISSRIDAHHQFLTSYFYVTHPATTPFPPAPLTHLLGPCDVIWRFQMRLAKAFVVLYVHYMYVGMSIYVHVCLQMIYSYFKSYNIMPCMRWGLTPPHRP